MESDIILAYKFIHKKYLIKKNSKFGYKRYIIYIIQRYLCMLIDVYDLIDLNKLNTIFIENRYYKKKMNKDMEGDLIEIPTPDLTYHNLRLALN